MDIKSIILIFMVILSVTLLVFICNFGSRFIRMYQLMLEDAIDGEDLKIRKNFVKRTVHMFAVMLTILFTEIAFLCAIIIFCN